MTDESLGLNIEELSEMARVFNKMGDTTQSLPPKDRSITDRDLNRHDKSTQFYRDWLAAINANPDTWKRHLADRLKLDVDSDNFKREWAKLVQYINNKLVGK